jgi:putative transposase
VVRESLKVGEAEETTMTKHPPDQIITKLRAAEVELALGLGIGQVCQKLAISEQTFHRWRAQYGGLKADEAKRLNELEAENARLKRLVAELAIDKQMLQEAVQKKGSSSKCVF